MVFKIDDGFENLNSGCVDEEPEEAGPGVMGHILISLSHMKEKAVAHSPRKGNSSTPITPRGVETSEHDDGRVEDLEDGSHNVESPLLGEDPQRRHLPDQEHNVESPLIREDPQRRSLPDQQRNVESPVLGKDPQRRSLPDRQYHEYDSVGLDSAETGGQIRDGLGPMGSSRSAETGRSFGESHEWTPASPKAPPMDLGEKIISFLPGFNISPYSVGNPNGSQAARFHDEEDHSAPVSSSSSHYTQRSTPSSPSHSAPVSSSSSHYTQRSTPTSPSHSHFPKFELITKLVDKLHLHEKGSSPRGAATENPGTPSTNTSIPSANTEGMPAPTLGAPSTTIGTATGPTEN